MKSLEAQWAFRVLQEHGMNTVRKLLAFAVFAALVSAGVFAQDAPAPTYAADQAPPPSFSPEQLDQLVARVALYPDSLLAQVLAAATYPNEIPDAARWADQHHYLTGQALADAIQGDQLPWDPSVQALLPFPSVLDTMASNISWTTDLGNAFLASQQDVMDAVQRERHKAEQFGYLRTNPQVVVSGGPYISIAPVDPAFVVVPYYDPGIVFFAPRPGFFVGGAIRFGFGVSIGGFFRPWGWGVGFGRFDWGAHRVYVNNAVWGRTWVNRGAYVHPYVGVRRYGPGARVAEQHELHARSERERAAAREGRPRVEEHERHH
jgi:uncharacterized protein DUF3300